MGALTYNQAIKNQFLEILKLSIEDQTFVSLVLMNNKNADTDIKKLSIRPVSLKKGKLLNFVSRFSSNDITKNYSIDIGVKNVAKLLEDTFSQGALSTFHTEYFFAYPEKGKSKLKRKERKQTLSIKTGIKNQKTSPSDQRLHYLFALGIADENGTTLKNKHAKLRQINKFVEIISPIIVKSGLGKTLNIVDMGSGKAYLSFALYDHLKNNLDYIPHMTGVERRSDLVSASNDIAVNVGFENLSFREGNIETTYITKPDILIALHACNTATDDAIAKGIHTNAKMIICSPCCHKQIRKKMSPTTEIASITQYGILKERQAEIVTDTIRALILKAYGYKTNIIEFITTDHTAKNLLITAVKESDLSDPLQNYIEEINALKKLFGISEHHLEKLTYNKKP